jgi:hypothetical protein
MNGPLQTIGLCRFSVPSLGGFQTIHDTIEARRAMLYAPMRLDQRLAWFEHVALPGIRDQTDKDFTLVLLIGNDLPDPWRRHLLGLVRDIPEVRVESAPPLHHRKICADAMRPHVRPDARVLAQFRLDDDDAVAVNFVARLKRDLGDVIGLLDRKQSFALDYGRGLLLRWTGDSFEVEPRLTRQWTPALVYVNRPEADRYILDTQHHRMWHHMPVVSQTDELMWVRGDHATNDSRVTGGEPFDLPPNRREILLADKFGIDLTAFARRLLDNATPPT